MLNVCPQFRPRHAAWAGHAQQPQQLTNLRAFRSPPPQRWVAWRPAPVRPRAVAEEDEALAGGDGETPKRHFGDGFDPDYIRRTALLSYEDVMDALQGREEDQPRARHLAFYSSELGGIVTDPALMVVPIDDHLVHRGHGVFDTATLVDGYLYELDEHLERFQRSLKLAHLRPPFSVAQMRRIILETAAAGRQLHGSVRYWVGAGPGGFALSPRECLRPTFYCVCFVPPEYRPFREIWGGKADELPHLRGWAVRTTSVPVKPPLFAAIKSNNYLPNVLAKMEAEALGFDQAGAPHDTIRP